MIYQIQDANGKEIKTFDAEKINEDEVLRNYPIGYKVVNIESRINIIQEYKAGDKVIIDFFGKELEIELITHPDVYYGERLATYINEKLWLIAQDKIKRYADKKESKKLTPKEVLEINSDGGKAIIPINVLQLQKLIKTMQNFKDLYEVEEDTSNELRKYINSKNELLEEKESAIEVLTKGNERLREELEQLKQTKMRCHSAYIELDLGGLDD